MIVHNKEFKIHLEIETGMNRTGVKIEDLDSFIELIKSSTSIKVEGVYTHLSSADTDTDYTNMQLDIFKTAVQKVLSGFDTIKFIHSLLVIFLILYFLARQLVRLRYHIDEDGMGF